MEHSLQLNATLGQWQLTLQSVSPAIGLRAGEMELLLDRLLRELDALTQKDPPRSSSNGSFVFWNNRVQQLCKEIRIDRNTGAPHRRIEIELSPAGLRLTRESELRLASISRKLTAMEQSGINQVFATSLTRQWAWALEKQWVIVDFVARKQMRFLHTGKISDQVPLTQLAVAEATGCHATTISRLVRNLALRADGRSLPLRTLIPGPRWQSLRIKDACKRLRGILSYRIAFVGL